MPTSRIISDEIKTGFYVKHRDKPYDCKYNWKYIHIFISAQTKFCIDENEYIVLNIF